MPGFNNQVNNNQSSGRVFSSPAGNFVNYEATQPLNEDELSIIMDFEEESLRLGNFERIFPLQSNSFHYSKFFEFKRPSNILLMKYLKFLHASYS